MKKITKEQKAVAEQFLKRNLTKDTAIAILGKELFDVLIKELCKPVRVEPKVRPWDTFMFTILKIPNDSVVVPYRWSLYGAVLDNNNSLVYSFSSIPSNKMICIGKFKSAMEAVFGEFDLRRGGHLSQLHALDNSPKLNENVILFKQVRQAPWLRVTRKPKYEMAIGSTAIITPKDSRFSITAFDDKNEVVIEDRTRQCCIEVYAKLVGWIQSVDKSPLFGPANDEWHRIINKRNKYV